MQTLLDPSHPYKPLDVGNRLLAGSVSTAGRWPLADAQEWLYAKLIGADERARRVAAKLNMLATWDGSWPEAYDEHTGAIVSRHWFAWPAAAWPWLQSTKI